MYLLQHLLKLKLTIQKLISDCINNFCFFNTHWSWYTYELNEPLKWIFFWIVWTIYFRLNPNFHWKTIENRGSSLDFKQISKVYPKSYFFQVFSFRLTNYLCLQNLLCYNIANLRHLLNALVSFISVNSE